MADDKRDIQLLPVTRKEIRIKTEVTKDKPLMIAGGVVVLAIALYIGVALYVSSLESSLSSVNQQLIAIENGRDKKLEKRLLNLNRQLTIIGPLLANHIKWSKGFKIFQSSINPKVRIKSLTVSLLDNKLIFNGSTDSYITVAKQIAAFFSNDTYKDIELGKVTLLKTGEVEFSAEITFDPEKMLK